MKIGIELELWSPKTKAALADSIKKKARSVLIEEYRQYDNGKWSIIGDGSLYDGPNGFKGMEIVSPILNTDYPEDIRSLRKLCDALQTIGCVVDNHCGLHVHFDAADMSVDDVKSIFGRYSQYEELIDLFMPSNRRGELYYAKSGKGLNQLVQQAQTKQALGVVGGGQRYWRVNLDAMQRHGTIEFRQHSASINADTIINWISFLEQFIVACSKVTPSTKTLKRRGRKPLVGMSAGCQKVFTCFVNSYHNGGGDLRLETIASRTALSKSSILAYISTLKTKYGIIIKKYLAQHGNPNPLFYICNPTATPRIVSQAVVPTSVMVQDTLWRGINPSLRSYYLERIQELNGFNLAGSQSALVGM